MGLWGRSCLRWRAREPREPLHFVSLALLACADVPGVGGISVECLVIFESASSKRAGLLYSRARSVHDFSVGLPTAREYEFSKTNHRYMKF